MNIEIQGKNVFIEELNVCLKGSMCLFTFIYGLTLNFLDFQNDTRVELFICLHRRVKEFENLNKIRLLEHNEIEKN